MQTTQSVYNKIFSEARKTLIELTGNEPKSRERILEEALWAACCQITRNKSLNFHEINSAASSKLRRNLYS